MAEENTEKTARDETAKTFEKIFGQIEDLPTLPKVFYNISTLLENPKVSASDVTKQISKDPALTAKILRIVNSAFYGLPQKISTLTQAIVILGFSTVKNLVLASSVSDFFAHKIRLKFDMEKLWYHSLGTGIISRLIAVHAGDARPQEAFIGGLLHDVGKVVLCKYEPERFKKVLRIVETENELIYKAEERVFGFTHTDIGAFVATKWNLPPQLVAGIEFHHTPRQCAENVRKQVAIVHLAEILCRVKDLGSGGDNRVPDIDEDAFKLLGISYDAIARIMYEATKTGS